MNESLPNLELLETILETLAALVVVMDTDGRVVIFNDACQQLSGYSFEEMEGRPLWERLVPEGERDGVKTAFDDLRSGQFPNHHANDWITRDGDRRTIEWSNSALTDADGQVRYVIATGVDITRREEAEERKRQAIRTAAAQEAAEAARDSLRVSEAAFSGIVDLSADAIISIDIDQCICQFNQGAEEIFGYTADEAIGQPLSMLLPADARDGHHAHVRSFSTTGKPSKRMGERGQIYGMRKNGEIFPAAASISKQRIDDEWLFTAVLRDVSEERQAEQKLQRANIELARSNDELEKFAAVASHDLQEPLRKIQAFGGRLAHKYATELPERGQDYLDRMQRAAGRMSGLIEDLLSFSRVTSRAQPFEPVDLSEIVEQTLADLELSIERTNGQVDVGDLPCIDADATQIGMVFQNLIGNALKFHREGVAPVVQVTAERLPADEAPGNDEDCDSEWYQIVVEDNGIGFDEKYLDRIFDVFQRLHGRGTYEGTGVGLAIVRKIVERHGGTVTAQSSPGEGARFCLTLPAHQSNSTRETTS
ncbi:MAG: sensor histidine kinase [Persicimonas sp.]